MSLTLKCWIEIVIIRITYDHIVIKWILKENRKDLEWISLKNYELETA